MRVLTASLACLFLFAPLAQAQDDVGSSHQAICCGANCCRIDGVCRTRGDTNPANSCQECDPGTSNTAWTDIAGCTAPDAGPGDTDAGSTGTDAGSTGTDAGSTGTDAGSTGGTDAGTGSSGGGCSASPRSSGGSALFLALAGAVFFWRRRR